MSEGNNHSNVPAGMLNRHLPQQLDDGICSGLNFGFPLFLVLDDLEISVTFMDDIPAMRCTSINKYNLLTVCTQKKNILDYSLLLEKN